MGALRRAAAAVRAGFRLHIDLPSVVMVLLLASLIYRPLVYLLSTRIRAIEDALHWGQESRDFLVGVTANVVAALFIVPVALWLLRIRRKSVRCGRFRAFDETKGEEPWGEVRLTYNLFSDRVRGQLTEANKGVVLELEAAMERDDFLRGHYLEVSNLARRRLGAFLMVLQGNGDSYKGKYVFFDPSTSGYEPEVGSARWERIR